MLTGYDNATRYTTAGHKTADLGCGRRVNAKHALGDESVKRVYRNHWVSYSSSSQH